MLKSVMQHYIVHMLKWPKTQNNLTSIHINTVTYALSKCKNLVKKLHVYQYIQRFGILDTCIRS